MTEKLKHWSGSWQAEMYKMAIGTLMLIVLSLIAFQWVQAIDRLDNTTTMTYENSKKAVAICKDVRSNTKNISENKTGIKENRYDINRLKYGE